MITTNHHLFFCLQDIYTKTEDMKCFFLLFKNKNSIFSLFTKKYMHEIKPLQIILNSHPFIISVKTISTPVLSLFPLLIQFNTCNSRTIKSHESPKKTNKYQKPAVCIKSILNPGNVRQVAKTLNVLETYSNMKAPQMGSVTC